MTFMKIIAVNSIGHRKHIIIVQNDLFPKHIGKISRARTRRFNTQHHGLISRKINTLENLFLKAFNINGDECNFTNGYLSKQIIKRRDRNNNFLEKNSVFLLNIHDFLIKG